MSKLLRDYLDVWDRKPVLRAIYDDFYDRMAIVCRAGVTIEIGGGIGNLKQRISNVFATDIQFAPWLDCVADAQRLPFAAATIANIVMVDVLHHIEFPAIFFGEAERVLMPGGRAVMIDPAITLGSTLFYRLFHQEPVAMSAHPLVEGSPDPTRDPYDSNQAIPTLIATRDYDRFHHQFPNLKIKDVRWFSFFAYPLSGGFKNWSLISNMVVHRVLRFERVLESMIGRLFAFRMMIVIEKSAAP